MNPGGHRTYSPAWWASNPHVQTLWARLLRPTSTIVTRQELWETPDGDVLEIRRLDAPAGRPRIVVLHGLEGTIRSHYLGGVLTEAQRRDWGVDIMLFRGCGEQPNRTRRFYHSGETEDIAFVVDRVTHEHPDSLIGLAGFSLGGNVLLKWLGERGASRPANVAAAAAVSVPFDLGRSAAHIDRGFARVYQAHFLRSLRRKTLAKMQHFPDLVHPQRLSGARSIRAFDDVVTAPIHGFRDAEDYYARSSAIGWIEHIRLPTLLLNAVDDPFLPPDVLADVQGIAQTNPALHIDFPARGGHVGFVSGRFPWRADYWAERRVADFLAVYLEG